ncbi:MAG TPA: dihydroorotase [Gammaproteobacteria bacterium]|nr:dihydroorotase [Gammaproteobacteria bacterium]
MHIAIRNGRVIDPASGRDRVGDVFIAEGRIAALDHAPDGFRAERELNATGWVVGPGLVDLRAHLREPGEEHKGTIASETRAAAAGGITTVVCPPDTVPPVDTPAVATLIHDRALAAGHARVLTVGALTQKLAGSHITEMGALQQAGCVGVGNARRPLANPLVLRRAMEYAATFGLTVFVHPEDPHLANQGCAHEGRVSARLGLPGIPEAAETAAVATCLALIPQTGARVHFCGLSTQRAVRMVARARFDGVAVSADVSAHHLHLTEMDIGFFNSQCHVQPPLRHPRDRDGLRAGLAEGVIDAICSDHLPHEPDAKLGPFPATAPGISALETLLPLGLRLVRDGLVDLPTVLHRLSTGPARLLGIDAGHLQVGAAADLCLFDPEREWTLSPATLLSRGHNSPFSGWQFRGQVMATLLNGRVVYERPR